jgi:lysophospholipase L1-like esterase
VLVSIALLVALGVIIGRSHGATQDAASGEPFYLVIGGSSSLGMQPTGVPSRNGRLTSSGYADDLVGFLRRDKGVNFDVAHVGCPGETAQSLLDVNNGGRCNRGGTPQLTKAINYLVANQARTGFVSIDVGFNDVRPCRTATTVDATCMSRGMAFVSSDLPQIIQQLKAAAGPHVFFVGLEYNDPFLADFMSGSAGPAVATATLEDMNQLNAMLNRIYSAAGIAVANVPAGFQMNVTTRIEVPNVGEVPENVEMTCQLTWMCQSAPFGPDDHPDNAGYMVIAESIAAVLPSEWRDNPVAPN